MREEYPGLPNIARHFWRHYLISVAGFGTLLLFMGAISAIIVRTFLPEAIWYLVIAGLSYVLHTAALFISDLWNGDYDPSQTTFSSAPQVLGVIVVMGVVYSTILLIGTVGAFVLSTVFETGWIAAAGFAAYYPVLDTVLMRRKRLSPGAVAFLSVLFILGTVLDIHSTIVESFPVIGKRERPQT